MWSTTLGFTVITCNILELNENSAQFRFLLIKNFLSLPNKIKKAQRNQNQPLKKKKPQSNKKPKQNLQNETKPTQTNPRILPESPKFQNFQCCR